MSRHLLTPELHSPKMKPTLPGGFVMLRTGVVVLATLALVSCSSHHAKPMTSQQRYLSYLHSSPAGVDLSSYSDPSLVAYGREACAFMKTPGTTAGTAANYLLSQQRVPLAAQAGAVAHGARTYLCPA